jgi:UDP-glucose 4-epimerase
MAELNLKDTAWIVTGAAGYIGSHISQELLNSGALVIGLDNFSTSEKLRQSRKDFEIIEGDVREANDVDRVIKKAISLSNEVGIIHTAGFKKPSESIQFPFIYYSVNSFGTAVLAEQAQKFQINKFIFSSSCSVYGDTSSNQVDEKSELCPISPYGRSKLFAEKQLIDIFSKANYIILRYFNVAGIGRGLTGDTSMTNLFPAINNCLKNNNQFTQYGFNLSTRDGSCIRDYIHVLDIASAHVKAAEMLLKHSEIKEIINLGNSQGFSVIEIIKEFEKISGKKCQIHYAHKRVGDPDQIVSSNTKAKSLLQWTPAHNLTEMVNSHYLNGLNES